MDRFCFGVIAGLAIAAIVNVTLTWREAIVIVPVYLIARYFAYKLSEH